MKYRYLKHDEKITINRNTRGNLNDGNTFETTVGEATRRGYFRTDHGTMSVHATHEGRAVEFPRGLPAVQVPEDWEIAMNDAYPN